MESQVCNIGPNGQKRRKWIGNLLLVVAGILSGFFIATHAPAWERVLVFPFFAAGFISLLQAQTKVCVTNAMKKTVEVD